MALTPVETEAIILKATTESLDELVNHELFELTNVDPDTHVVFRNSVHQRLFNILLVDITSNLNPAIVGKGGTMLEAISAICATPLLGTAAGATSLRAAVESLDAWLKQEVAVSIWFPPLAKEGVLRLTRQGFIYICGNIAKHGFARLNVIADKLGAILEHNGLPTTRDEALSVLDDFYQRFHTDIFTYHGTTLAELLNNVRCHTRVSNRRVSPVPRARPRRQGRLLLSSPDRSSYEVRPGVLLEPYEHRPSRAAGSPVRRYQVAEAAILTSRGLTVIDEDVVH
jgi:hypothetical protein